MKTRKINFLVLAIGLIITVNITSQTVYMSGPGLIGETTNGIHANETPLEAIDIEITKTLNQVTGSYDFYYYFTIQKKINASSLELIDRLHTVEEYYESDYVFKFYDDQDNHYFTITTNTIRMWVSTNHDYDARIMSPDCIGPNGNCANHFEEYHLRGIVGSCTYCNSIIIYTNELTGQTNTYE